MECFDSWSLITTISQAARGRRPNQPPIASVARPSACSAVALTSSRVANLRAGSSRSRASVASDGRAQDGGSQLGELAIDPGDLVETSCVDRLGLQVERRVGPDQVPVGVVSARGEQQPSLVIRSCDRAELSPRGTPAAVRTLAGIHADGRRPPVANRSRSVSGQSGYRHGPAGSVLRVVGQAEQIVQLVRYPVDRSPRGDLAVGGMPKPRDVAAVDPRPIARHPLERAASLIRRRRQQVVARARLRKVTLAARPADRPSRGDQCRPRSEIHPPDRSTMARSSRTWSPGPTRPKCSASAR